MKRLLAGEEKIKPNKFVKHFVFAEQMKSFINLAFHSCNFLQDNFVAEMFNNSIYK